MGDTTFVGGDACFLVAVVLLIRALPLPLRGLRDDLLLLEIGPPIIIMTGVGEEEDATATAAMSSRIRAREAPTIAHTRAAPN